MLHIKKRANPSRRYNNVNISIPNRKASNTHKAKFDRTEGKNSSVTLVGDISTPFQ